MWIQRNVLSRISVTGYRSLALHVQTVTGDTDTYNLLTNYGHGLDTFTDTGQLSVVGNNVLGLFNFNFQFADSRFQDPTNHHFSLDYSHHGVNFDAGDLNGTLRSTNRFLNFNRQLSGVQGGYVAGRFRSHLLESVAKGSAETVSFAGNGSQGPYYLRNSQIIPNTVQVQVDGVNLTYPDDFTVDSVIGAITFTRRAIAATSTVLVSYESTGVNSGGGELTGGAIGYDLGKYGSFDFAAARQTDPTGKGLLTYTDRYQGYGDASIPYYLQYQPLTGYPVVVRVDGIVQTLGFDYLFSTTNPLVFYFTRAIPSTSTVDVTYTPKPTDVTRGDRSLFGLGYTLPIGLRGRDGSLSFDWAKSLLSNVGVNQTGEAKELSGIYRLKHTRFSVTADDIPNSFVGIDSTTFLRNERSYTAGFESIFNQLTFGASQSNSSIGVRQVDANGNVSFVPTRSTDAEAYARYAVGASSSWDVRQSHTLGTSLNGDSRTDQTSLTYTKQYGTIGLHLTGDHTTGFGPISNGTTTSNGPVKLDSLTLKIDDSFKNGWNVGSSVGISKLDINHQSGTGRDYGLRASYIAKNGKFIFNTGYDFSNSGDLANLGTLQSSIGNGYNGNGFSAGDPNSSGSTFYAGGTNLRRLAANLSWVTSSKTNLSLSFNTYSQEGSDSSNSEAVNYGLSSGYDIGNRQRISVGLYRSLVDFIGSTTSSNSTSLSFDIVGSPKGPWSYQFGLSSLLSTGGTSAQNALQYNAFLRLKLRRNQALLFNFLYGTTSNYQAQNSLDTSLGYEYQLFKNIALVGRYFVRRVTNLDPTITTGAYASHGLDLQLNFNFGY